MAQYSFGNVCYNGDGVKRDKAEAAKWYRKAAEQEVSLAQYNLGALLEKGEGVPESGTLAFDWYLKQRNRV